MRADLLRTLLAAIVAANVIYLPTGKIFMKQLTRGLTSGLRIVVLGTVLLSLTGYLGQFNDR